MSGTNGNGTMSGAIQADWSPDYDKSLQWSTELKIPEQGAGEVLVRVSYVASNPVDYKLANGNLKIVNKQKLPHVIGRDYSGIIVAVGPSGKGVRPHSLRVGDRVCGLVNIFSSPDKGCWAEYVSMPGHTVVKLPDTLSLQQGAGLPLCAQTTYQSLKDVGGLGRGAKQKVLILGGTTATGTLALQMCRDFGCTEVCCTSSQEELAKQNGATEVFNYRNNSGGDWSELWREKEFDLVYDCIGGSEGWVGAQKVLGVRGRFVTIVGDFQTGDFTPGRLASTGASLIRRKFRQTFGSRHLEYHAHFVKEPAEGLRYMVALLAELQFKTIDEKVPCFDFTIEGARAMYRKQESGTAKGKLLMKVYEPSEGHAKDNREESVADSTIITDGETRAPATEGGTE